MLILTLYGFLPSQNGCLVIVLTFTIVSSVFQNSSQNSESNLASSKHDLPYFAGLKEFSTCSESSTIPLIFTVGTLCSKTIARKLNSQSNN
jgi:uncharacterized membrane protein